MTRGLGAVRTMEAARRGHVLRTLILFESVAAGVFIVCFKGKVLPESFGYDSTLIQRLAAGHRPVDIDTAYTTPAHIYAVLGLADHELVASLIGYALGVVALLAAARAARAGSATVPLFAFTVLCVFLCAVYLGFYTKDVFTLGVTFAVLWSRPGRRGDLFVLAVIVAYALTFRSYWVLVALAYPVLLWALRRGASFWRLVGLMAALTVAMSLAVYFIQGEQPDFHRVSVQLARVGHDQVATEIRPFVDYEQPLGGVVNNVMVLATLMLPLPLLASGGLYHAASAVVIFLTWLWFWRATGRLPLGSADEFRVARAAAVMLSFAAVQALFEPDYGSVLRHLTPLLPLMLLAIWRSTRFDRPHDLPGVPPRRDRSPSVADRRVGVDAAASAREVADVRREV